MPEEAATTASRRAVTSHNIVLPGTSRACVRYCDARVSLVETLQRIVRSTSKTAYLISCRARNRRNAIPPAPSASSPPARSHRCATSSRRRCRHRHIVEGSRFCTKYPMPMAGNDKRRAATRRGNLWLCSFAARRQHLGPVACVTRRTFERLRDPLHVSGFRTCRRCAEFLKECHLALAPGALREMLALLDRQLLAHAIDGVHAGVGCSAFFQLVRASFIACPPALKRRWVARASFLFALTMYAFAPLAFSRWSMRVIVSRGMSSP